MNPTPIPDDEIWEGAVRKVIAPPGGDFFHPTIRAVEMLVDRDDEGAQRFCARVELDDRDVERITNGERVFWYSQTGEHLHPFSIGWGDGGDYADAVDPYPEVKSDEEAVAIKCPGWAFAHASIEVPLTEAELEASRATDGKDARRGYWRKGPWCCCGKTYTQHTDAELFRK